MLKTILFIASALPIFVLVKTLLFKRHTGLKTAASNFNKQVGYLSAGIATILFVWTLYYIARVWFRW